MSELENLRATQLDKNETSSGSPERLSDSKRMLIEQRIANEKPSTGAAYLLCLFLGAFGIHRLYLGEKGTGIVMLILGITIIGLLVTGVWAFIDLFLIPSIIRRRMDELRQRLTLEAM
ncbi:TM2 domain-containing protein [Altererythrobacter aquiaggeris]|uniref:TM2 domain-containing protein n=1 Tax=Aestuarierythrobacter aquiaggeris TaxID=1898396 RepID=UPI0030190D26